MSERSIYFRDQADQCRWHADHMTDVSTQTELRNLAATFVLRAMVIENDERHHGAR